IVSSVWGDDLGCHSLLRALVALADALGHCVLAGHVGVRYVEGAGVLDLRDVAGNRLRHLLPAVAGDPVVGLVLHDEGDAGTLEGAEAGGDALDLALAARSEGR